jgi:hypothetical protein
MTIVNRDGNWNIKELLGDLMGATAEVKPEPRAEIWVSDLGKALRRSLAADEGCAL